MRRIAESGPAEPPMTTNRPTIEKARVPISSPEVTNRDHYGVVVIHGDGERFVEHALEAIPGDADVAVIIVEAVAEDEAGRPRFEAMRPPESVSLESGRRYRATVDELDALLVPLADRVVAITATYRRASDLAVAYAVKRGGGSVVSLVNGGETPDRATFAYVDVFVASPNLAEALGALFADAFGEGDVENDEQLRTFLRLVRQRTGIDFGQYKMATIRRRLQRQMIAADVTTLGEYARHLQQNPSEFQRLVHEFLIKVTDFFRDDELFEYLRSDILPQLVEQARDQSAELRIWSAGCATGEEAYSLAILLAEIYGEGLEQANIKIFATDLDESAIAFARHGVYPRAALRAMPAEWIERYFTETPSGFEVRKRIRVMTIFGQHDLGQRAPFPRTDLVLCRNVLIYFTKELQQRTLQLFASSLREGGVLVLGKSETISPAPEYFRPVHLPNRTYRRYGGRALIPPPRMRETPASLARASEAHATPMPRTRSTEQPRSGLFDRFGVSVFAASAGYVLVDRRYDVLAINASARRMLGVFGLGIGEDLVHLVQGPVASELRALLDLGLQGGETTREIDMAASPLAETRRLRGTIFPERAADGRATAGGFAILRVEDISGEIAARETTERSIDQRDREILRFETTLRQLTGTRDAFAQANQELSTANLELRSTNDTLLISVEEAETSTEEIQTLNEEMPATNEELETLNEELQATIEELNTTNDELHVRSVELQGAIEERDHAFDRSAKSDRELAGIFAELPIPVVHYRKNGTVGKMNDSFLALLEVYGDPLPLRGVGEPAPLLRAARGEVFEEVWSIDDGSAAGRRFRLRAQRLSADGHGILLSLLPLEA